MEFRLVSSIYLYSFPLDLEPNQSENCNYNPISVNLTRIMCRFIRVHPSNHRQNITTSHASGEAAVVPTVIHRLTVL